MQSSKDFASRVFSRFAPFIKDHIYSSGWSELRSVQLEAAKVIFFSDDDLVITSATASGKTEAAFFPILSLMAERGDSDMSVLYISPLKSLINDQFLRMEQLLDGTGIELCRWHGDVPLSVKRRFLKNGRGLVQITPESLESLLINHPNDIPRLFAGLEFIVLDEIHTLPGRDRGEQTRCIIERISAAIGRDPRRIGLSATVGDSSAYAQWLSSGSGRKCSVVDIPVESIRWRLAMEHFYSDSEPEADEERPEGYTSDAAAEYIYKAVLKKKSIVFSNSREETEHVCSTLRQIAKKRGHDDIFYIHHGNLSAAIREGAEYALKDDGRQAVACATVTLELGIDIGRLERIVNVESPNSVTSFLQRMGRSGRRDMPPEMLMVFREQRALPQAPFYQLIPWQLIQAIAVVQLYLEERWVEPPRPKAMPLSLLFHQILSNVASMGSIPHKRLGQRLLRQSAFKGISGAAFSELVSHMVKNNMLSLDDKNELMIGEKGEKLLSSYRFYAGFKDNEEFMVREGSNEIGTVTSVPPVGDRFALAGRVWEVLEHDVSRRTVFVKAVDGKMEVAWPGDYGEIHTKIVQRMKRVLTEDCDYPYLCENAKKRLEDARALARSTKMTERSLLSLGSNSYVLFPWRGTVGVRTLKRFLKHRCAGELKLSSVESTNCFYITFKCEGGDPRLILEGMASIASQDVNPWELVGEREYPVKEKFDANVPQRLLLEAFCRDELDLEELNDFFKNCD